MTSTKNDETKHSDPTTAKEEAKSEQKYQSRAIPFLSAFNDIETHLRIVLEAKRSDSFWWMVDRAVDKHLLSRRQGEVLKDYGNLRNAISHGRYNDGEPIAEPHPVVVKDIEMLRGLLIDPPSALSILQPTNVVSLSPNSPVADALKVIREEGFAQIPIYEENKFVQLLTTNTISRWVANDLADNNALDARTIQDVLGMVTKTDQAVFLARDISAQEAVDALISPDKEGRLPYAAIVTESGERNQKPLRIITTSDLAVLIDSLSLE
ncbi:CBS domain-containing protein [Corynebacteriaceae bacterium 6-324]